MDNRTMMQIDGNTEVYGLLGFPVCHTLSPVIHNTLNQIYHRNSIYIPCLTNPDAIEEAVAGATALHLRGLNVTVPHKQAVIPYLSRLDETAKAIGAVNTLVPDETGKGYAGYNTDAPGLKRAIASEGISLAGKSVVLLGAGGASRAAAYLCITEGAREALILNRSVDKGKALAEDMNRVAGKTLFRYGALADWEREMPSGESVVFQCTSLGLYPKVDQVAIADPHFYQRVEVGVDLIYNPAKTRFMELCESAGKASMNGLKMLLYQAIVAYELWTGITVSEEAAKQTYEALYEGVHPSKEHIVLVGYMGSGKTTIGRELEAVCKRALIDTDAAIEEEQNTTIRELFETKGETYFRDLETEYLRDLLAKEQPQIISTGGGIVLRPENVRLLREIGTVYYLHTSEGELYRRLKCAKNRPLLDGTDLRKRIADMMKQRDSIYRQAAHVILETDGKDAKQLAKEILASWEARKKEAEERKPSE